MTKPSVKTTAIVASAVAAALTMGVAANSADAAGKKAEKCYGVAKAGKNDCATNSSSCAGTSKTDGQKDAFIFVPAGLCAKLVGSSATSS